MKQKKIPKGNLRSLIVSNLLIGFLFLISNLSYSQNDLNIYDNLIAGEYSPGPDPLFLGDGKSVGVLVSTGSSDLNLKSLVLSFWQSQPNTPSYYSNFTLEIYNVTDNAGTISIAQQALYSKTFSSTYLSTTIGELSTLGLNLPYYKLLANSKYLVSVKKDITSDTLPAYWVTHSSFSVTNSGLTGWNVNPNQQGVYIKGVGSNQWQPIGFSLEGALYLRLVGATPNASVNTANVSQINYDGDTITAISGGTNIVQSNSDILAKGVCWSTSPNPTLSDFFRNEGGGTSSFSSTLLYLLPNTTYYVRAYVTDASGTYYGQEASFSTNRAPVITSGTTSITISENNTNVTTIQALDVDVPAQSLLYSITGGADASKFTINSATGVLSFITTPDFEFPSDVDANNSYVVSVQVSDNGSIPKSAIQTITVNVINVPEVPVVNSFVVTNTGITGAALSATVASNGGGGSVVERGFVYSLTTDNSNPTLNGIGTTKVLVNGTLGDFNKAITGLISSTSYSFRAFATNTTGSSYSETISLTTNGVNSGPSFSYDIQVLQQNQSVAPISPVNVGTSIASGTYSKVSSYAGSSEGNVNDVNPLAAKFNAPMGMVMDASRNLYFADSYNHRIKKIDGVTGAVTQIAGQTTPTPFLASDSGFNDGTGVGNARFDQPSGMTFDGQNAIYVADRGNNKIRKIVLSTGAVSTVAGGGTGSQSGYINATGTAARFLRPTDVVFRTESGTSYLYVADAGNHCIRKINLTTNAVTTFAGSNTAGSSEGNLTSARFNNPTGLAFSSSGILYVVDRGNQKIRKIDSGTVSTFAGSGTNATTNGTGTGASFADPYGIAIDGAGNLYISQALDGNYPTSSPGFAISSSDNNYIRKITTDGVVSNFIGSGTRGVTNNSNGLLASLSYPTHLFFDTNQNYLYVSEWYGDDIRKVDITGYSIVGTLPTGLSFDATTGIISGTPSVQSNATDYSITGYNYFGSNTTLLNLTVANLPTLTTSSISSVTSSTAISGGNVSSNGGIALIEKGICWSTTANPTINNNKIVDPTTTTGAYISNLTGLSSLTTYYVRAYATNALGTSYGNIISFTTPIPSPDISYNNPNVFSLNTPITPLQVTNTGGAINTQAGVVTIAGTGSQGTQNGPALQASFSIPNSLFVDSTGAIYIADNASGYNNRLLRKLDVNGNVSTITNHAYSVSGIVVDNLGTIYTSENYFSRIYKKPVNGSFSIFAQTNTDGVFVSSTPSDLILDSNNNLFFADSGKNRIGKVTPEGQVSIYVGEASGTSGGYLDGPIATAKLAFPQYLTKDSYDNKYFYDANNGLIRKIDALGIVSTLAGIKGQGGYVDGPVATARIGLITGLVANQNGDLFFVDNKRVRKLSNGIVSTIAGAATAQYVDGSLSEARFNDPGYITIDNAGNLYLKDTYNIRKIAFNNFKVSPDLPAGLVLNSDGSISGTPTIVSPATDYTITATNAGGSSSYTISIAVENVITTVDLPTASAQTLCQGSKVTNLTATGTNLKWYSTSTGGNALNPNTTLTSSTYYVSQTISGVESARVAVNVSISPNVGSIGSISGSTNLASTITSATYSVAPVTGATSYVWELPSGMTLLSQTGASINVNLSSSFSNGIIRVKAINACSETSTKSLRIQRSGLVPAGAFSLAISGNSILCPNSSQTYTATEISEGTYFWTIPSTTSIISGQGTRTITLASTASFTSGQIKVVCTTNSASQQATYNVSGATLPSIITGPSTICGLTTATYSVQQESGVTYQWNVPNGMTIVSGQNSSTIVVSIENQSITGSISVRSLSACGISNRRTLDIGTIPIINSINGATTLCGAAQATIGNNGTVLNNNLLNQYTYSVTAISGVTSYQWSVPNGSTIISGQGSNSIVVNFDLTTFETGLISVQGTNNCGNGVVKTLLVSSVTGNITGPTNLCPLSTAAYSVPSDLGTNFEWDVPQGMTITSGNGTSSIQVTISHPVNFNLNNQVSVSFQTECGGTRNLKLEVNCSNYSNLTTSFCEATNINPYEWIYANSISGATEYRFNIYDQTGSNLITTIDRTVPYFRFYGSNFSYGTTYVIKVQIKQNGLFNTEGSACHLTLINLPTTSLKQEYCGITEVTPYQWLFANTITGATEYRFNIYDETGSNLISTIDRTVPYFRFYGSNFSYGTTYQVKIQAKQNGVYSSEGTACNVTLMNLPTTSLSQEYCGITGVTPYQWLFANAVTGATEYRFNIYDETGSNLISTIDRTVPYFRFYGSNFSYGTTYQVKIQAKQNGVYGSEGRACNVSIQEINTRENPTLTKHEIEISLNQKFVAFPNPFKETFRINLLLAEKTEKVKYQIFDIVGKLIESNEIEPSMLIDHSFGSEYPRGVYIINIEQGDYYESLKMIKQ